MRIYLDRSKIEMKKEIERLKKVLENEDMPIVRVYIKSKIEELEKRLVE